MLGKSESFREYRKQCMIDRGNECREMRISYNYTQTQLAEKIGISQNLVSKFERGEIDSVSIYCSYVETLLRLRYEDRR